MVKKKIFHGWWILSAGIGIAFLASTLLHYGFSAFFIPWRQAFGWPRSLLGGVVGMSRLEGGLVAPIAGWLIDNYGPRRMMFIGIAWMGLGFFALSRINSIVQLYIVFIGFLAAGASFGLNRPAQVAVANWFRRRRGLALGLLTAGSGLGGSVVFVFAMFISAYGWRAGAMAAGFTILAVGFPLASVIRHKPEDMGLLPDGDPVSSETLGGVEPEAPGVWPEKRVQETDPQTARRFWMKDPRPEIDLNLWQALRLRAFWFLALTYAVFAAMPGITTVHIAPFLAEELDLEYVVALSALSFFVFASVFGRVGFGALADHVNIRLLLVVLLATQGVGMYLFSEVRTLAQVPFYVILFAVPYGGTLTMRNVLQGYFFGRKEFGTIGGFLQLVDLPATVAAPIWVGYLADVLPDGYRLGFKIIAGMLVVAAVAIFFARRPEFPFPSEDPPGFVQSLLRKRRP